MSNLSNEAVIAIANAITANSVALKALIEVLPHDDKVKVSTAAQAPVAAVVPNVHTVVPNVQPAPIPTAPVMATPTLVAPVPAPVASVSPSSMMPPPPSFVTPVAAPVQAGVPFTDAKGLLDYVMGSYKAMGAAKGAGIQGVLTSLGLANINDVKPEQYAALYAGVESLK